MPLPTNATAFIFFSSLPVLIYLPTEFPIPVGGVYIPLHLCIFNFFLCSRHFFPVPDFLDILIILLMWQLVVEGLKSLPKSMSLGYDLFVFTAFSFFSFPLEFQGGTECLFFPG